MANSDAVNKGAVLSCLLLVGTLLALSLVIARVADEAGVPRLTFLMMSLLGAGLTLLGISIRRPEPTRPTLRSLEYALVSGALLAFPNALGFLAVRHVGAGFVTLSFAFPILVTWLIAVLVKLETFRTRRLVGVVLALLGGIILAGSKAFAEEVPVGWVALIPVIPVVVAVGNIYRTLRWPSGASPLFLAALMMIGAALSLVPVTVYREPGEWFFLMQGGRTFWLLVLETAVFAVLYRFYFVLQKMAGPVYFSQIGTVAAVVGSAVAVLFLGEALPPHAGLAGVLVAVGLWFFHRSVMDWPKNAPGRESSINSGLNEE